MVSKIRRKRWVRRIHPWVANKGGKDKLNVEPALFKLGSLTGKVMGARHVGGGGDLKS